MRFLMKYGQMCGRFLPHINKQLEFYASNDKNPQNFHKYCLFCVYQH